VASQQWHTAFADAADAADACVDSVFALALLIVNPSPHPNSLSDSQVEKASISTDSAEVEVAYQQLTNGLDVLPTEAQSTRKHSTVK